MNKIENLDSPSIESLIKNRIDFKEPKYIEIITKHVGNFCEIYMVRAESGGIQQKFILRIFGRNKDYQINELEIIREQILLYQAQLNSSNLFSPYYSQKNDIQITNIHSENLIVAFEPWFGDSTNHFDLINSERLDKYTKFQTIIADMNLLISLASGVQIELFGKSLNLLKVGIDSKPDNFTTHQNTTVYIDLYPPLPILENKRIHHHPKLTAQHKMDSVTYMMGTLEGVILRYIKSAEFRLSTPYNITQFYDDLLQYLKPLIDEKVYKYIFGQIKIYQFDDLNHAYQILLN